MSWICGSPRGILIDESMVPHSVSIFFPFADPTGNMVIDIGGGTTEVAIISMAAIVWSQSIRVAGNKMNFAIMQDIRRNYNLLIGGSTAEIIKTTIGNAFPDPQSPETIEVKDRDLLTGIPKILSINSEEIRVAILEQIGAIAQTVKTVLEYSPPELLKNLDKLLSKESGLPITTTEDPLSTAALGIGTAAVCLSRNRLRAWMDIIIMAIGIFAARKPKRYPWITRGCPVLLIVIFIVVSSIPYYIKKENGPVDTDP